MRAIGRLLERVAEERRRSGGSSLAAALSVAWNSLSWRLPESLRIRLLEWSARSGRASATTHGRLALLRIEEGRVDEALAYWRKATELDPDHLPTYRIAAYDQLSRGHWDEANDWFAGMFHAQRAMARRSGLDRSRLRVLDSEFTAVIGTLAHLDIYVKQHLLDGEPLSRTLLFAPSGETGNRCYLDYWIPWFPGYIEDAELWEALGPVRAALRFSYGAWPRRDGSLSHFMEMGHECERRWEAEGRAPLLELSDEHRERGRAELRKLGVPDDAWFAGLHVRAADYHGLRNADVETYWKAMAEIVERGGWVLRIGDRGMPRLQVPEGMEPVAERVVDYVFTDSWSDWMDIFILAEGRFLLGTQSGPVAVPGTFGVPAIATNWCPMTPHYWYGRDLYIPKRYWSERDARLLGFREILGSPIGFTYLPEELAKAGVRAIDNTPEEIRDVVVEMLDRLDGKQVYGAEDETLYRRLDRIESPSRYPVPRGGARIGRDFLRASADLLEN